MFDRSTLRRAANLDRAARPLGALLDPRFRRAGRWIAFSTLIGVVSGVGAFLFDLLFRGMQSLLLGGIGRYQPAGSGVESVAW